MTYFSRSGAGDGNVGVINSRGIGMGSLLAGGYIEKHQDGFNIGIKVRQRAYRKDQSFEIG